MLVTPIHSKRFQGAFSMRNYINHNDYYVYYYLRSTDTTTATAGTPYYVGRGRLSRIHSKHRVRLPSVNLRVKILENLTFEQANQIEILHIKLWGRKDINTGILHNMTDGGDGTNGYKRSPEVQARINATNSKPDVLLRRSISQKRAQNQPDTNTRRKATLAVTNQIPEVKRRRSEASLKIWSYPDHVEHATAWRQDPERLNNWLNNIKQTMATLDSKHKRSLAAKESQNRSEVKEKQALAKQRPITKAQRSASNSRSWTCPEVRAKRIESMKSANNKSEIKALRSSSAKDYYASEQSKVTCEVCGKVTTKQGYGKGHGPKCKSRLMGE